MKNRLFNQKILSKCGTLHRQLKLKRITPSLKYAQNRSFNCEGNGDQKADLAIIGGGPAGLNAALRAKENGIQRVIVVDKFPELGGNCINHGCIPSKCLLNFTHNYYQIKSGLFAKQGIVVDKPKIDLKKMMGTKNDVVKALNKHMDEIFKSLGIKVIRGFGKISGCNKITVDGTDGKKHTIKANNIMIATGSDHRKLPNIPIDEECIITSEGALNLKKVPKRFVIVGAGIIGLELGSAWSKLGSEVTIISDSGFIGVPKMDEFMRCHFQKILEQQGIKFILNSKLISVEKTGKDVTCKFRKLEGCKTDELVSDVFMVSVGRVPHTEGLCLERVGIEVDKWGFIPVDRNYQTKIPHFYAVGDVIQGPMTAHKALEDGVLCVDGICGKPTRDLDWNHIPLVIYTEPELASVGKTEEDLQKECIPYHVKMSSFKTTARAMTDLDTTGYAKALICRRTNQVLGTHMICAHAGEIINEATVIQQYKIAANCIARTVHAHPTYSKIFKTIYNI